MIPENLIARYKLVDTGHQIGQSFLYNELIFRPDIEGYRDWLVMGCRIDGTPDDMINLYNPNTKQWARVGVELADLHFHTFMDLIK